MGLLKLSDFSSIPNLSAKIRSRRFQKERYTPTLAEWAVLNGERIVRNSTSAGAVNIYTVPLGRVLFITAVHVAIANESTPNARGIISIGNTSGSGVGETLLNLTTNAAASHAEVGITFGHLVKVESGEFVQAKEISSNSSSIGFIGFELPKSLEIA